MAEVTLTSIDKHYGTFQALKGVNLNVPDGSFTVFVGPSGCGKSTLLRAIAGLEEISAGSIGIGGRDVTTVPPSDRGVGMVFQSYALYPHMTVRENMDFGLKIGGEKREVRDQRIAEAARILRLEDYLERRPSQLSGGQRQRVAIGRAIVKQPQVFLFDEPLSNLDAKLRIQMRVELEALHHTLGATMIYVTHDQVEAMTMADQIVVLNAGEIEQVGPPLELYHRPATRFVADFIGAPSMNFLTVEFVGGQATYRGSPLGDRWALPDGEYTLGIRPEHLGIGPAGADGAGLTVTVRVVEQLGGETYLHTESVRGDSLVVRTEGDRGARVGEELSLGLPKDRIHLFDRSGGRVEEGSA
jgi:ABC-type sugar transport system ATPase subunit